MRNVLDDDKIIGALRAEIRQASYIPTATARKPEEYEWELEQLRIESAAKADSISDISRAKKESRSAYQGSGGAGRCFCGKKSGHCRPLAGCCCC